VPGPTQSRRFSEQCVVDVPGAGQKLDQLHETNEHSLQDKYSIYLPLVIKSCTCHAVCACDTQAPTPSPTASPVCVKDTFAMGSGGSGSTITTNIDIGNLFQVSVSVSLTDIEIFMEDVDQPVSLWFFVYEGSDPMGTFTLINQTYLVNSDSTAGWYGPGSINVYLASGRFYYIGVSWEGAFRHSAGYNTLPLPASFGQLVVSNTQSVTGYPPAESIDVYYPGSPFGTYYHHYMRLTTCPPGPPPTPSPTPSPTPTATPCSCYYTCSCDPHSCSCNPQTYYHCTCNPQTYYHCVCNPQTYWW
jgi:hypothetical protein